MDRLSAESGEAAGPFSLEFRAGGMHDSRVESASADSSRDVDDSALALNLAAGWRTAVSENFGFRLGYTGYASFFKDLDEYNTFDQTVTVEAQWSRGRIMYSLPLGYSYALKDGHSDHSRLTLAPTGTIIFPRTRQALSFYGLYADIKDLDDYVPDEDGRGFGGGCAYVFQLENRTRFGLSLGYQRLTYDSLVADYDSAAPAGASADRRDKAFTAGADIHFPLSPRLGLYVDYIYTHNDSNVNIYNYDRHIIQAGVSLRFPAPE